MEQHLWRVRDAAALRARAHALRPRTRPARSPLARSSSSPVTQSSPPLIISSSDSSPSDAAFARVRFESLHALFAESSSPPLPSSPTPLPSRKRPRAPDATSRRVYARVESTPSLALSPHPRRILAPRIPETPNALVLTHYARARLLGHGTPRTPAGSWPDSADTSTDTRVPAIQVTPPPCEVDAVVARSSTLVHDAPPDQRAYAAALLAADHAALERLTWRLDLALATLACASDAPPLVAARTARSIATLLMEAWNPPSTAALATSPPSLRMNPDIQMTPGNMLSCGAELALRYRTIGTIGGVTASALANHLADTVWFMVVRDPRRTFQRPEILAEFVTHFCALLIQWETLEQSMHARQLPVHHLAEIQCCSAPATDCETCAPVSGVIRTLIFTRMRRIFADALHVHTRTTTFLQPQGQPGIALVDAARFIGELFKRHAVVDTAIVSTWLDALLHDPPRPTHVEGACALLLLAYPQLQYRFVCHSQTTCDAPEGSQNILDQCVPRLAALGTSTSIPTQLQECIKVSLTG